MPTHYWGDTSFDWNSLYLAIDEASSIMRKYGRIGVHSKEKYGTARWSLYFCDGTMHSITHPGYVSYRYPKWLWRIDVTYKPLRFIRPIINFWQKKIAEFAFHYICLKYSHIVPELISDAPHKLLSPHLELIRAKMWVHSCKQCEEWNTTDLIYCKKCGGKL